ncbi:fimbria/pilus outer membrane usher protein [Cupriavidus pauculus]|uniref:Fimbrial biogenesis outer membrane usher protein n=1 Tax=Cupriavidus pauculus TaxID=82633 RepID=A0A3G8H826_9BURK|nr:fimbria/pilus outer membrane usher protein [Cupriavidus pauculus]AZG16626.1 fimbrial biogenesis outer membrane usher protein [Cupriavidus pauculus]
MTWRRRPTPRRATLSRLAMIAVSLTGAVASSPLRAQTIDKVPGHTAYLEVMVNGESTGSVARFADRDGTLLTPVDELLDLGLRADPALADAQGMVALDRLPGVTWRYDPAMQRVYLTVPDGQRMPAQLGTRARERPPVTPGTGFVLNYDAYAQPDTGQQLGLYSEQRLFHPGGVFSNTGVATVYDRSTRYVRLDTSWTHADPTGMQSVLIGDMITGALPWSRPVRLGGFQLRRNFGLRPDLITYPLPALAGSAAVPGAVDLYINNVRQYSGQVPSGPFVINNAPALSGAGQATIVVRDALGRDVSTTVPLYVDARLLAPGLFDYALEVGFLRTQYGVDSFRYDSAPAANGSVRYGWTDSVTLEAHAEASRGVGIGGAGVLFKLPLTGVLNVAASASAAGGAQLGLGYQWRTPRFSIDVQGTRAFGHYEDLAARSGAPMPRALYRATVSVPVARNGNIAASYVNLSDLVYGASRIGSLAWTAQWNRRTSLTASAYRDFAAGSSYGASLTLTYLIDSDTTASATVGRDSGNPTVIGTVSHATPYEGGWGWQVAGQKGAGMWRGFAQANFRGRYGDVFGAVQDLQGRVSTQLGASGSLVAMDGTVMAGRRIDQSFALVSTGGVADLPVLVENRRIGNTNRSGHILVPNLLAYDANRVEIDALALPVNTRLSSTRLSIAPALQSGALATFRIESFRGAQVMFVDGEETPLPPGTAIVHLESGGRTVVGYDGLAFFGALGDDNTFRAETDAGVCTARLHYRASADPLPRLGPVRCAAEAP